MSNRGKRATEGSGQRELATPGDKRSWDREVDRLPSDEGSDPKPHEPRHGDLSKRDGDRGDTARPKRS
jgi:hypothetical protein